MTVQLPREIRRIIWTYKIILEIDTNVDGYILFIIARDYESKMLIISSTEFYEENSIYHVFEKIMEKEKQYIDTWFIALEKIVADYAGKIWTEPTSSIIIRNYWKNLGPKSFFQYMNKLKFQSYFTLISPREPAVEFLSSLNEKFNTKEIQKLYDELLSWESPIKYDCILLQIDMKRWREWIGFNRSIWLNPIHTIKMNHSWNSFEMRHELLSECKRIPGYFWCNDIQRSLHGRNKKITTTDPNIFWDKIQISARSDAQSLFAYCIIPSTPRVEYILDTILF